MALKKAKYSQSFFQEQRLKDYEIDKSSRSEYTSYRLKKSVKTDTMPVFNLSILVSANYSTIEIHVEPNEAIDNPKHFEVLWRDNEGVRGIAEFIDGDRKDHLYFAAQIYDQIERECEFYLKTEDEYLPILEDEKSRDAFHITMIDYYGLLETN